jgi:plastocyanin
MREKVVSRQTKEGRDMRAFLAVAAVVTLGIGAWGCSGNGNGAGPSVNSASPTAPNGSNNASDIVTVNVVAINGAQSFSPNPATLTPGQRIVWHNIDSITHRVVLNDGSMDTGDLAPGASSQPKTIGAQGAPYHCSIHPEMIGSINQDTSSTAPPPSASY